MRILEDANKTLKSKGLGRTIRGLLWTQLTKRIFLRFAVVLLKREANKCNSIEELCDRAYKFNAFPFGLWSIRPLQVKDEIIALLKILLERRSKFILEIGTAVGGTLFLLTRVADPSAVIISIDLPGGRFGGGYPELRIPLYKSFAVHKQRIHLIRADSHVPSTVKMVKKILEGRKLDLLFLDGDHTYDGVKTDFEIYRKLVGKGGLVAFHDICPHPPETGCEVNKFWLEIKDSYDHIELVRGLKQGWGGIGVLYV